MISTNVALVLPGAIRMRVCAGEFVARKNIIKAAAKIFIPISFFISTSEILLRTIIRPENEVRKIANEMNESDYKF